MRTIARKILGLDSWGSLSSWDRVAFDWANYGPLRNRGFSHRNAILELNRLWQEQATP